MALSPEEIRKAEYIIEEMHPLYNLTMKQILQNPWEFRMS